MKGTDISVVIFAYGDLPRLSFILPVVLTSRVGRVVVACEGEGGVKDYLDTVKDGRLVISYTRERSGKAQAYNRALPHVADSDVVFLVSADVSFSSEIFERLAREFEDNRTGVVVPRIVPLNIGNFVTRVAKVLWDIHDVQLFLLSATSENVHGGEFLAFRRGFLPKMPENTVNDDAFLCVHAVQNGYALNYLREATVMNRVPFRVRDLLLQRQRVNLGHIQLSRMGKKPAVLTSLIFDRPRLAMRILLETMRQCPEDLPYLPVLVLEEICANLLARANIGKPMDFFKWEMAIRDAEPEMGHVAKREAR